MAIGIRKAFLEGTAPLAQASEENRVDVPIQRGKLGEREVAAVTELDDQTTDRRVETRRRGPRPSDLDRTRVIFRSAEFGFLGVIVRT